MKKIFTSILFACCSLISMAQQLSFVADGKTLESGSKYISDKVEVTEVPVLGASYKLNSGLFLKAEKDGNIVVSLESKQGDIEFCSLDGSCINVAPGETKEKIGAVKASSEQDLQIHFGLGFSMGDAPVGTAEVIITAWYEDTPNEKVSLNVVMSNDPQVTAIEAVETASAHITFADGSLVYQFAKAGQYTLSVYSLSGEKVMQQALEGESGKIFLPLHQGVYVYTVNDGTACPAKGKILVK